MAGKPIYAVGLDAGSRRTRMVICALEKGRLRFLGGGVAESRGLAEGTDHRSAGGGGLRAGGAPRGGGRARVSRSNRAVVGMGGPAIRGNSSRGFMELEYVREIEQRDVNRVLDRAIARAVA